MKSEKAHFLAKKVKNRTSYFQVDFLQPPVDSGEDVGDRVVVFCSVIYRRSRIGAVVAPVMVSFSL